MQRIGLLFIVGLLISQLTYGRDYTDRQFAMFDIEFSISKDFREEMEAIEDYIDGLADFQNRTKDALKSALIHHMYYYMEERLEREVELDLLPVNTFLNEVKYDDYGYPRSSVREALRVGYSDYYIKVDFKLESITGKQREVNPELFEGIDYAVTMPQMTIDITVYNDEGIIPVDNWTGVAAANAPIPITNDFLKGYDGREVEINPEAQKDEKLYLLFDRAISHMINKI